MWPILLDMTEEESVQSLRHLELEAYSSLVSALRAQGFLNSDKKRILRETSILLNISPERHKAEVRRANSDEKLNTIAYHITGQLGSLEEWTQEGRRLVPLLPRAVPQTTYSLVADEASDAASQSNKQLPFPVNTERKRPLPRSITPPSTSTLETNGKPSTFRVPEVPKDEVMKRRKCHSVSESSSLAQHLLSPKLSKIQQIYRQTSKVQKTKMKESVNDTDNGDMFKSRPNGFQPQYIPSAPAAVPVNHQKINIIQNVSITPLKKDLHTIEDTSQINNFSSENMITKPIALKPNVLYTETDTAVMEATKQAITTPKKTINIGQKVLVVSNTQTMPTNSILQKTLSVPMNKLTKLNLDKFKLFPPNQLPSNLKQKMVTLKGTSTKKVIPLSQLQMLNSKGLRMIPYDGKIEENVMGNNKPVQIKRVPSLPEYFVSNNSTTSADNVEINEKVKVEINGMVENGLIGSFNEITVPEEVEDVEMGNGDSYSSESGESEDINGNGDLDKELESETRDFYEQQPDEIGEVLQEFEVIHTDNIIQ